MSFTEFALLFFVLIFIGSLAITGWYFVTRGEWATLENGKKEKRGKIFRDWSLFWLKEKPEKMKVYFDEKHLAELYDKIRTILPMERMNTMLRIFLPDDYADIMQSIQRDYDIKFFYKGDGEYNASGKRAYADYSVYREYEQYVFPMWVRHPIAGCVTCFSSIYGALFYWPVVLLPKESLFAWSSAPALSAILFYIVFALSLAVVNTALAKKYST